MNFRETLKSIGIIPVIQINDAEKAVPLARALDDAAKATGLPAAEVTFRTDAAEEAIRRIKVEVPDVCVCAGTVLNVKTAERAVKAGASAIISPGTNPEVVRWCIAHRVPVIPGCATPTEVEACMRMGLCEAVPGGGCGRRENAEGPRRSLRQYEVHAHRRYQRAERGGVPCAAERAVLRRQLDGAGGAPGRRRF